MNVDSIQDVGGGSRDTKALLASRGRQVIATFNDFQARSIDRLSDVDQDSLSYEVERFHVWANSIGLLHQGHSSLDYRLRDAGKLTAYIEKLLADLEQASKLLIQFCLNDQQPGAENASDRSDTSDESEDRSSGAAVLITELADINDRLYRFATQVRNPKARLYSAKAQKFRAIDPESGIDLIQLYRNIDKEHIRQIFLSLRRGPLHSSEEVSDASDMPKEPRLTTEDEILISRLATANTHRRQQFGQWREHQVTMTSETTKELNDQHTNPVSKPSTATALLNPGAIRLDDNMSSTSGMTISPSARSGIDEDVEIPDPPKVAPRAKHFICPYCFYLCSISTLKKAAWREHVLRDLRPYVCTYADCKEGDQLYDRWKDWANHEQFSHAERIWRCTYHPSLGFENVEDFKRHWQTNHRDQLTSPDEAARSNVTISQGSGRLCPICRCGSKTTDSLLQHIATHLQRIALFALPKNSSGEDDDDSQQENAGSTGQVQVDNRDSVFAPESMTWSASDHPEDSKPSLSRALTKEALGSLASGDLPEDLMREAYFQNLAEVPDDTEVDVDMKLFRPRRRTGDDMGSEDGGQSPQALSFVSSDEYMDSGTDEETGTPARDRKPRRESSSGYSNTERLGVEDDEQSQSKLNSAVHRQEGFPSASSTARILPRPASFASLKGPPIHQDIITHHRHIRHGFEQWPASNSETGISQTKEVIQGERHDANEQDVKGKGKGEEEEVMLQYTESQQKDLNRVIEEDLRARMRKILWDGGYSDAQIERMMTEVQGRAKQNSKPEQVGQQTHDASPPRPSFLKVHRKHLDPETLNTYELPWKWDEKDSDYIVIEKWIPAYDEAILFEHTRRLRLRSEMDPPLETPTQTNEQGLRDEKRGKTRFPAQSVSKQALVQLGYPFEEEEGGTVVVLRALDKEAVDEIVSLSREFTGMEGEDSVLAESRSSTRGRRNSNEIRAEIQALEEERKALRQEREKEKDANQRRQSIRHLDAAEEQHIVKEREPDMKESGGEAVKVTKDRKRPDPKFVKAMLERLT